MYLHIHTYTNIHTCADIHIYAQKYISITSMHNITYKTYLDEYIHI